MASDTSLGSGKSPEIEAGQADACTGRVVALRDGTVIVQVSAREGCDACANKQACHLMGTGQGQVEVTAAGFKVGDRVRIESTPSAVVRASAVLYLLPAVLVLTGSLAGYFVAMAYFGRGGDLGSLVVSVLFIHYYRTSRADGGLKITLHKIE